MRLGIIGSRKAYQDHPKEVKYIIFSQIKYYFNTNKNLEIVTGTRFGDGKGVDQQACSIALDYIDCGVSLHVHDPQNKVWEPHGFKERNIKIAKDVDILIAILSKSSKSYGAKWTADYAEKIGKKVIRVEFP
jgi:hypothetical protein